MSIGRESAVGAGVGRRGGCTRGQQREQIAGRPKHDAAHLRFTEAEPGSPSLSVASAGAGGKEGMWGLGKAT